MSKYGKYLYDSLPRIYRQKDAEYGNTLQRYLEALGEGFDLIDNETGKITTLTDVENVELKFLPFYSSMFGVDYDFNVPEEYQRRLLANIVDINKRKGTKSVIEFLARELTGMKAIVKEGNRTVFKTWNPNAKLSTLEQYSDPKTYGGEYAHYLIGGDNTDRFTIVVSLSNSIINQEEVFFNTQLLAKLTSELVPPYITVLFKAFGLTYKDSYNVKATYSHLDRFYTHDTYVNTVLDKELSQLSIVDNYKTKRQIGDSFKDIARTELLHDVLNTQVQVGEPQLKVKEILREFVDIRTIDFTNLVIQDDFLDMVNSLPRIDNKDTVRDEFDMIVGTLVSPNLTKDFIHSEDSSTALTECTQGLKDFINTLDSDEGLLEIMDSLHTKYPTSDIIEIKEVLEEFSDNITEIEDPSTQE